MLGSIQVGVLWHEKEKKHISRTYQKYQGGFKFMKKNNDDGINRCDVSRCFNIHRMCKKKVIKKMTIGVSIANFDDTFLTYMMDGMKDYAKKVTRRWY